MTGFETQQEAANSYYAGKIRPAVMSPEYGPMVRASDILDAFAAGAAWQKERMPMVQAESDVGDLLPPNAGGYRLHLSGKGPHELFSFGNPDALLALKDLFATRVEPEGDGPADAFQNEMRDALGTLGEGMAEALQCIKALQVAGLRGSDRGVAILKHLQEIGDNVRGVSGAIGDRFGVVLDAVKDVGEKVEACMTIASNTEEGLSVSIEKLDKLGVEKWREAIKHVEAEGITEPMHAEVKAEPVIIESNPEAPGDWVKSAFMRGKVKAADYDESGLGKLWADVTVNLEDVSDETLRALAVSGQISEARYFEEYSRRHPKHVGVDPAHGADAMAYTFMRDGKTLGTIRDMGATSEGFAVEKLGERIIVLYRGRLYDLRGMYLHPLRFVA